MPYIKEEDRKRLDCDLPAASNPGELNYLITMLITTYWMDFGPRYQAINDILGALEGAKQEFYRRAAVPYEDEKIKENGDVF